MTDFNASGDGSLIYDNAIECRSPLYRKDPDNPRRLIPNVPECKDRKIGLRTLICGRTRADWRCDKFSKMVSAKDCHLCQSPTTSP